MHSPLQAGVHAQAWREAKWRDQPSPCSLTAAQRAASQLVWVPAGGHQA